MLIMLDLGLCFAFPTVKESVREDNSALSIQKNLFLCLLRLFEHHLSSVGHAGTAERRASTGWGKQACSHQTKQTGEDCARPGEEHSFAYPFHYSRATPPQGGDRLSGRNGCGQFQQKLHCSALHRSSIVAGSRVQFGQWTHYW